MSVRRQKNVVAKTRIKGIAHLLLLLGLVAFIIGIVSLIDADAWDNPIFWISLTALLIGACLKFWRPIVAEPVELVEKEIAESHASDESLLRASELPSSQQQAELLRAAGHRLETLPEQLLRVTQENRQDD